MIAFQARFQQARKKKTTPANSPVGDHQANGRADTGVEAFQNMAWRLKLALESHLGIRLVISAEEPREADGELEVEVLDIDGGPNVESDGGDGVPAPIV